MDEPAPRLPRLFWVMFAGTFVNRVGSFVIPLFAIYLTQQRGYSPTRAGFVCSLWGFGSLCSGLLGGQLADRIGRRRTLLLGFSWGALAMRIVPLATSPLALALAAFHLGLAGDLYRPAFQAQVADVCTPAQRPRAYGLLYWAVNLGFAVATALGGLLARHGFERLFVADAATTALFGLVVFFVVPETAPPRTEAARARMSDVLSDGLLLRLVLAQGLLGLVFQQAQVSLPIALRARGIGPEVYGLVMAENGVLIVLLQPLWIRVVGRYRRTRILAVGAVLTGIGFSCNGLSLGVAGAALSVALWTLGEIASSPVTPALVADLAPPQLRGGYQGVWQMSFGACALLGPVGGTLVLEHGGATALWATCLALGIAAALSFLRLGTSLRARLGGLGAPA